ncbi:MAG: PKD domain-containing protein [Thermoanaerobaculia bacterium]
MRWSAVLVILTLFGPGPSRLLAEAPPLPSSRFGGVLVGGAPAPIGTRVVARLGGMEIAAAEVFDAAGASRYRLDVPGDRIETPEKEGPLPGESFEIRVAGVLAATAIWSEGNYEAIDLDVVSGPDLAIGIDDGVTIVSADEVLSCAAHVANLGPGVAGGVMTHVELPPGVQFVSASDGGTLQGTRVVWPSFVLGEGEESLRSVVLRVESSFPSGIDELRLTAFVVHDGSSGADPQPGNDSASDVDSLDAAPDLHLAIADARQSVSPGSTSIYRVVVANQGTQDATGTEIRVELPSTIDYFSSSHGGRLEAGVVSFPAVNLEVGRSIERAVTVRVPADLDPSVTLVEVLATTNDDGSNGGDPVPGDNAGSDTDDVVHLPDLRLQGIGLAGMSVDPQTLELSGEVTVSYANDGTVAADPHTVVAFEDLDADGRFTRGTDRILGELIESPIGGHTERSTSIVVAGIEEFRDDRIFVLLDGDDGIVELDEANNIGNSGRDCVAGTAVGTLHPVVELSWPEAQPPNFEPLSVDSVSTPIVLQLTDDNGDGLWNELDLPDIVFVTANLAPTYPPEPAIVLRAIRGDSGAPIWNVPGLFTVPLSFFSLSGLAGGDIDHDGKPEIVTSVVTPDGYGFLQAYEHNGTFKWRSGAYDTHPYSTGTSNRDSPLLADLDGDGNVEIVVGAHVFDRTGHLLWRGGGGQAYQTQRNNQLVGGALSVAGDIDLDGFQEVVTGNTVYRWNGEVAWQSGLTDGYPALIDIDDDPQAEVVVVSRGTVRMHETDGTVVWGPIEIPGSDPESGGAPSVGDLDGDGAPEIVVAGSDVLWAIHADGSELWQAATRDYSSTQTAAVLFDLDGDGSLDVIYRDERRLRLYRGRDGELLHEIVLSSTTMTEMPIVADVDRDGNAEIVVTTDHAWDYPVPAGERTAGIRVLGDGQDAWPSARSIWNQHAYAIDNVGASGSIPARPAWGWLSHNTFRAATDPDREPLASPDLSVGRLVVDSSSLPQLSVTMRIGNGGSTVVAPGLEVALYDGPAITDEHRIASATLESALFPGSYFDLVMEVDAGPEIPDVLTVWADAGARERECDESNNVHSIGVDQSALGLWLTKSDGIEIVAPGDLLVYSLRVHNAFEGVATGVSLLDELPSGVQFQSASDGGVESGGVVTWIPFAVQPGAVATRTVTVRIDPDLPLAVTALSNSASVSDDGSQGVDPTPGNNQAVDTDLVASVVAVAGGPYLGSEGVAIEFDGSGSYDRDGGPITFAWDLDGDDVFDDGTEPVVRWAFDDDGTYVVRLRVSDEQGEVHVDETVAEIGNTAPVVTAPAGLEGSEGDGLSLDGFLFEDPGAGDDWNAFVIWGDGSAHAIPLESDRPTGTHVYAEDGAYPVEVCVSDDDGGTGCASTIATVSNAPPVVRTTDRIDLDDWQREELGGGQSTRWSISADGGSATEVLNGEPGFLVGDLAGFGTTEWSIRVDDNGDDDYFGIAVGYEAGDLGDTSASSLLIDWKREDQSGARRGLALSAVRGVPMASELWLHQNQSSNGNENGVEELLRGATLGSIGWSRHTDYRLRLEVVPNRLRLFVDGRLELDFSGAVPFGKVALYDYSQPRATFVAEFADSFLSVREGELAALRTPFADPGTLDTHVAVVDWGDGSSGPAALSEEDGSGEVLAEHRFLDDGDYGVTICVTDDDGAEGCASTPAVVENIAPLATLVLGTSGYVEEPVSLTGSGFVDAGIVDTHIVSVDWGDGTSDSLIPQGGAGVWTVEGTHLYSSSGEFAIELCVEDDDGGVGCQAGSVELVPQTLDLELVKSVLPVEARPNANVIFTLQVRNVWSLPASGVVLSDRMPPHLGFVSATLGGVESAGVVTWDLGTLAPGATVGPTLTLRVDPSPPFGETVTNQGSVADDGSSGPDFDPSNNSSMAVLRFSDSETPIVTIDAPWNGAEGAVLVLSGVRWNDTTAGQAHTGTIDWGDGESSVAILQPSTGTSGTVGGSHRYLEDGEYPVVVCVTDATGRTGCRDSQAVIANRPPGVVEPGAVSLHSWIEEEYAGSPSADWQVAADGLSVLQRINSRPSIFYSPLPAIGSALEGTIRVEPGGNWDDDYIGFVIGFHAGDATSPEAEYLLIDWKQANQDVARRGLAVSWVRGAAVINEFWAHRDDSSNGTGNGLFEIARGLTLGDTGWADNREYRFRFETGEDRLRIWVDDVLQFDLAINVPEGRFGFYNYSQEMVRYRGFSTGLQHRFEGERFELLAPFVDPGVLDTHEATIDWEDGTQGSDMPTTRDGFGLVEDEHDYPDDGEFLIEVCVQDDEDAGDCGAFPIIVWNLPPVVDAASNATAFAGVHRSFELGTFSDPGVLDSHTATVDWGDLATGSAEVEEDRGRGSIVAAHSYAEAGSYPVTVCVEDDDGGSGCDSLMIDVFDAGPATLRAEKRAMVIDRDGDGRTSPGDEILYRIEVLNEGGSAALAANLTDPVPANTVLVPGSVFPESGVISLDPIIVAFDPLEPGATAIVQFVVVIDEPLATGVTEIVNSGVVAALDQPAVPTDDPDQPGPADPTRTPVASAPRLAASKVAELIDVDGDGAASAGDLLDWRISVQVQGDTAAVGLLLQDQIDPWLEVLPETVSYPGGRLLSLLPVAVVFDSVPVGNEVIVSFRTEIAPELPPEVEFVSNQATLLALDMDPVPSDDPATPEPLDPTVVPVYTDPTLSIAAAAIFEGDGGVTPLVFHLHLDRPARRVGEVSWTVLGISAASGEDFEAASGSAVFGIGDSDLDLPVSLFGDSVVENDETLRLLLSAPVHLDLAQSEAVGTIVNDDSTALSIADDVVTEGEQAELVLSLSAPSALPVSVEWTTVAGSAQPGEDYVVGGGTVILPALVTTATLVVATVDDDLEEETEVFLVELANPTIASISDGSAIVSVLDDDQPTCTLTCPESLVLGTDPGLCSAWVDYPGPVPSDGCGPVVCTPGSGPFELGVTVVSCSAEDGSSSCSFQVTVLDIEPPAVTPPNLVVPSAPHRCEAEVSFAALVEDNCPGVAPAICLPANGSVFPVGTTAIDCSTTDAAGNTAAATGSIEVLDLEPPSLADCPESFEIVVAPGGAPAPVEFGTPLAMDNCPGVTVGCLPASGDLFPAGETAVTCTAVDAVPLTATCDFTVSIIEPSVLEIPALSRATIVLYITLIGGVALFTLRRRRRKAAGAAESLQ